MIADIVLLVVPLGAGLVCLVVAQVQRARGLAEAGERFRVVLPAEIASGAIEHLLLALHGTLRPTFRRLLEGQPWLAFELVGTAETLELFVWVSGGISEAFLRAHVEAALPGARVEPAPTSGLPDTAVGLAVAARGSGVVRTDVPSPGLASVLAGLRGLGDGEEALVQVVVRPRSPRAQRRLLQEADSHLRGSRTSDGKRVAPSLADRAVARRLQQKAAAPLFTVGIRVAANAATAPGGVLRTRMIVAGFHQFATAEVQFTARRPVRRERFLNNLNSRSMPLVPAPSSLNSLDVAQHLVCGPRPRPPTDRRSASRVHHIRRSAGGGTLRCPASRPVVHRVTAPFGPAATTRAMPPPPPEPMEVAWDQRVFGRSLERP